MKINQVLVESTQASVAFAFGRFNPAHQGHIEVWRAVEDAGANWFIGTNATTIGPNDPLTFEQKSAWMEEIYPPIAGHIVAQTSVLTLATYIFKKLRNNEGASIAYITDETDWAWSGKLLNQYNGKEGAHGYYKFAEIIHVPSPRVSSATALRDAARADDKVAFYHASGTDPKAKVAGLTYFDTVKQACEKYPVPVKKAKKVKEEQIDEIDRRGFLKGLGAAAVAGGAGYKMGQGSAPAGKEKYFNPKLWYLCGYLDTTHLPEKWEREKADNILSEVNGILRNTNDWNRYIEENQKGHAQYWKDLDAVREKLGLPPFKQEPLARNQEMFSPWQNQKARTVFNEIKKLVGYMDESVNQGVAEDSIDEHIVKVKGGWELKSKHGDKNLGKYPTKAGAEKRERQVQYFKHASESVEQDIEEGSVTKKPQPYNEPDWWKKLSKEQMDALGGPRYKKDKKEKKIKEDEQKTQAKTWDQMTPQEKSSGVKGRTVWNEKTRKYYTVFDVPVKQEEVDEASLATMRDYFAGDENARDPYDITKQRLHFAKDKNVNPTVDKRFRSPEEYQQWLAQNKLKPISHSKGWSLINKNKA
jgi:hypothetical protein